MNPYSKPKIVYEDDSILAVFKDHDTLVIPDRYNKELFNLKDYFTYIYGKIFVVHRLDRGTAGIVIFAKDDFTQKRLTEQFEKKAVDKQYICITQGVFKYPLTSLLPISKRNYRGKYKINFKSGKKSITTFYPIDFNERSTLIAAKPLTGRSHQIRVHLKSYGTPLFYDFLYNKNHTNKDDKRLSLQAYKISFTHPKTGEKVILKTELTDFMHETLNKLGLKFKNLYFS